MFKRLRRKFRKRSTAGIPQRILAPVDEIAEQGMLVADVAVRMEVKNDIIMNALKANVDYDEAHIIELVRESVIDLADERKRDAKHIDIMLERIRKSGFSAFSETQYRDEDNRTLNHRREVYELVAKGLRERSEDDEYLRQTAERSRELAWAEIGTSLADRAMHPYYSGGGSAEYQEQRERRIAQFVEKDLGELLRDQHAKRSRQRRAKD